MVQCRVVEPRRAVDWDFDVDGDALSILSFSPPLERVAVRRLALHLNTRDRDDGRKNWATGVCRQPHPSPVVPCQGLST